MNHRTNLNPHLAAGIYMSNRAEVISGLVGSPASQRGRESRGDRARWGPGRVDGGGAGSGASAGAWAGAEPLAHLLPATPAITNRVEPSSDVPDSARAWRKTNPPAHGAAAGEAVTGGT